jgi:hypothetical protein
MGSRAGLDAVEKRKLLKMFPLISNIIMWEGWSLFMYQIIIYN